jgi:hypothetical protein
MKSWHLRGLRRKPFRDIGVPVGLAILVLLLMNVSIIQGSLDFQLASANSHLGILGRQAPELNLDNWIDVDGEKMQPIQLGELRGKVVYLYFFQDW